MLIKLDEQEFERCLEFSHRCAQNQQQIEFGQADTKPRSIAEIGRDNLIGKMAEVAFAKMLRERCGIEIDLDFNYYPRGKWDDQDAEINGWRIDIKATRKGGEWMLIEWSKLDFRQKQDKLSHLYVMASVDWDRERDLPRREVDLVGCASIKKLRPGISSTKVFRKGTCIPNTNARLQADNYAIHFSNLENNWGYIIEYMMCNLPPDVTFYPNPYTGKPIVHDTAERSCDSAKSRVSAKQNKSILTWLKHLFGMKD